MAQVHISFVKGEMTTNKQIQIWGLLSCVERIYGGSIKNVNEPGLQLMIEEQNIQ